MARYVDLLSVDYGRIWVNPDQIVRIESGERRGKPVASLIFSNGHTRDAAGSVEEILHLLQG